MRPSHILLTLLLFTPILGSPYAFADDVPTSPEFWTEKIAPDLEKSFATIRIYGNDGEAIGTSAGFCVDASGLYATCFHAIGEGRRIGVVLPNGEEVEPLEVHAWNRMHDLAVLKIETDEAFPLPFAAEAPERGAPVAAIGNPEGASRLLTAGIVAAPQGIEPNGYIPLSMPIERGNSGGPAVNSNGEVIGVVALKDRRTDGLGYAVPVQLLKNLLNNPSPRPYPHWTKSGDLSDDRWLPSDPASWSRRAGRIVFRSSGAEGDPWSLCRSSSAWESDSPVEWSVEVKAPAQGPTGPAFSIAEDGTHYAWTLVGRMAFLMRVAAGEEAEVEILAKIPWTELRAHVDYHGWNRLSVACDGDGYDCRINGVSVHKFAQGEPCSVGEKSWGLHVSGTNEAEMRNAAFVASTEQEEQHTSPWHASMAKAWKLEREAEALRAAAAETHRQETSESIARCLRNSNGFGSLIETGVKMAILNDPGAEPEVYAYHLDSLVEDVRSLIPCDCADPERIGGAMRLAMQQQWEIQVRHEDDDGSSRLLDDPRRLFEDRDGGVHATSCLVLDVMRQLGMPHAQATTIPGFLICDATKPLDETHFLHVCDGEVLELEELSGLGCLASFGPGNLAEVLRPVDDREFLLTWLNILKNEVPERQWPGTVVAYLETILELQPDNASAEAELILFDIYQEKKRGQSAGSLVELLKTNPGELDRHRMYRILEFIGFNLPELLANHP